MDAGLRIMGILCVAMAAGHESIGQIWVLPKITEEQLPTTWFGPRALTMSMVRVTWHVVTIFAATIGGILLTFAWAPDVDPKIAVLRWIAGSWLVAAFVALWRVRSHWTSSFRLPVPFLWVLVAAVCWNASL